MLERQPAEGRTELPGAAARHDQGWRGALDQLARMMEAEGLPARAKG